MNRIYLLSLWFYRRKVSLNLFSKPSKEFRVFFTLITKSKLLRPKKFHVSLALASAYFSSSISSFSYSFLSSLLSAPQTFFGLCFCCSQHLECSSQVSIQSTAYAGGSFLTQLLMIPTSWYSCTCRFPCVWAAPGDSLLQN